MDKSTRWGDLESEEEESSEEEEEDEEDQAQVDTESLADGLSSVVSGYSSLPSGLETPEAMDLRKGKAGGETIASTQRLQSALGHGLGCPHLKASTGLDSAGLARHTELAATESCRERASKFAMDWGGGWGVGGRGGSVLGFI